MSVLGLCFVSTACTWESVGLAVQCQPMCNKSRKNKLPICWRDLPDYVCIKSLCGNNFFLWDELSAVCACLIQGPCVHRQYAAHTRPWKCPSGDSARSLRVPCAIARETLANVFAIRRKKLQAKPSNYECQINILGSRVNDIVPPVGQWTLYDIIVGHVEFGSENRERGTRDPVARRFVNIRCVSFIFVVRKRTEVWGNVGIRGQCHITTKRHKDLCTKRFNLKWYRYEFDCA